MEFSTKCFKIQWKCVKNEASTLTESFSNTPQHLQPREPVTADIDGESVGTRGSCQPNIVALSPKPSEFWRLWHHNRAVACSESMITGKMLRLKQTMEWSNCLATTLAFEIQVSAVIDLWFEEARELWKSMSCHSYVGWRWSVSSLHGGFGMEKLRVNRRQSSCSSRGGRGELVAVRAMKGESREECVLAIDVGTGGTKAALVNQLGSVVASAFHPHPRPAPSSR